MYLCYRGNTYCRGIDLLNIVNPVNPQQREQDATKEQKVLDDRMSISLKPTFYRYRGVMYLKSISSEKN